MSELERFLAGANLSTYHGALLELGVTQPSHLSDAEDEDLASIGMKMLEVKRLRQYMRGTAPSEVRQKEAATVEAVTMEVVVPDWQAPAAVPQVQQQMTMPPVMMAAPVLMATPAQTIQTMQTPMMQIASAQPWVTSEDYCKDGCGFYTESAAANDQNAIAYLTGVRQPLQSYTDSCEIFWLRYCAVCGGACIIGGRAERLKKAYSAQHGLVHQPISCTVAYCCPETVFKQIKRKWGDPCYPCSFEMSLGVASCPCISLTVYHAVLLRRRRRRASGAVWQAIVCQRDGALKTRNAVRRRCGRKCWECFVHVCVTCVANASQSLHHRPRGGTSRSHPQSLVLYLASFLGSRLSSYSSISPL